MRNDHYPLGSVRALLETELVQEPARLLLKKRLEKEETIVPVFFELNSFRILRAVCERLIPQPVGRTDKIDLPGMLDLSLSEGKGKGWRYDQLPSGKEMYETGLAGIDETAHLLFGNEFEQLGELQQDMVLSAVQSGTSQAETWKRLPAKMFFEEILASLAELYYSHPVAKEEIGEVAFADRNGWKNIGLNQLDPQEPLPIKPN